MSLAPPSPSGPGGVLHNYGINYNMLETILPNYGLIRRLLSRKVGIDISSILGVAFIGFTLTETFTILWRHAKRFASGCASWVTSSISLRDNESFARDVATWAAENLSRGSSRHLSASSAEQSGLPPPATLDHQGFVKLTSRRPPIAEEPDQFDDVTPPITYLPAAETNNWFWFEGNLIMLRYEQPHQPSMIFLPGEQRTSPANLGSRLILTCFGWSVTPLKEFLQRCKDFAAESAVATTTIYSLDRPGGTRISGWDIGMTRPSRPLSTVDFEPTEKQGLVDDISSYLGARQFYARRGIPYRRGYLFHGPPGTGKTSLASAIAGHFKLDMYMMSLADVSLSDGALEALFGFLPLRCVIMLEDVDAVGISKNREKKQQAAKKKSHNGKRDLKEFSSFRSENSRVTLSGLLNAIDGVSSKEGRILIMTTNAPEVLDKALIRPGRIDRQVFLGPLSKQNAKQIFLRMYTQDDEEVKKAAAQANRQTPNNNPDVLTMAPPIYSPVFRGLPPTPGTPFTPLMMRSPRPSSSISSDGWQASGIDDLDKMATAFMNKIPDKILTPAEVQGFLLSHRDDMLGALTQCDSWVAEMLNAKQRKSNIIKLDPVPEEAYSDGKTRQANSSKPLPVPAIFSMMGGPVPTGGPTPMGGPILEDLEDDDDYEDEDNSDDGPPDDGSPI